jgi:hypothetical protein
MNPSGTTAFTLVTSANGTITVGKRRAESRAPDPLETEWHSGRLHFMPCAPEKNPARSASARSCSNHLIRDVELRLNARAHSCSCARDSVAQFGHLHWRAGLVSLFHHGEG